MIRISIVIPVLNDACSLKSQRTVLDAARRQGHEVIVVDGRSSDESRRVAGEITPRVLDSERGRALQMNAGADAAREELLLFLHADARIEIKALDALLEQGRLRGELFWGRFDIRLDGEHWSYRVIEAMMNFRSRFTGIATGDQAMFVSNALFQRVGGFPQIPLMEDVALSKRLKKISAPVCLRPRVVCSSRRWNRHGIVATTLLMWRLRLGYFFGADPARLARIYYGPETDSGR